MQHEQSTNPHKEVTTGTTTETAVAVAVATSTAATQRPWKSAQRVVRRDPGARGRPWQVSRAKFHSRFYSASKLYGHVRVHGVLTLDGLVVGKGFEQ